MSKKKTANIITREGYNSFVKELEYLKGTGRLEAAEAIRTASEQGDLSENAEYDAAKESQAHLERRIYELEELLKNSEIIDSQNDGNITIGKTILVRNIRDNSEYNIKLVGNNEADPFSMKISVASPIGVEVLGKQIGDLITVDSPSGPIEYIILNVILD